MLTQLFLLRLASQVLPGPTGKYLARRFITPQAAERSKVASALKASLGVHTETLTLAGINITTYQWGDPSREPYVLLAHGWSSYALRFAEWIPMLRSMGYAVVGFDQPAHGASSGKTNHLPMFVEMIQRVGRHFGKPAVFIGHSMGASAVVFAQDEEWCPERFVLIAPFVAISENATRQFETAGISPKAFTSFEAYLYSVTGRRFAEYEGALRLPLMKGLALIIHDRNDRETPWEKGARFAKLWPGARLFTTEGLGHNRLLDHPSVINEVMNFIKPETINDQVD
ncbi:alpha/beta fold hydrolase [Pseudomonas alliivorans]|nr:alpha/beta fold hydrolase [Pseudomonas alliivorans]MEE4968475.1 alpha/beta fold hydrolase [Pseudomonas alliivorans]MEE4986323.1 alpha/beta fold hydrolase [Pseudomonas alliivorans]MEE4993233.1 alpha/beta fold hydrolase [Pseudomonas alliivorans]MEE5007412.1 alpha/beta fold hydrolase [Pseudomonas alliivorans]